MRIFLTHLCVEIIIMKGHELSLYRDVTFQYCIEKSVPASVSVCLLYRPCIILSGKTDKTDRETRQTDIHRQDRQDRQTRQMDRWIDKTDRQTAIERAGWSWPF